MIVFKTFFRLIKRNLHVVLIYAVSFMIIGFLTLPDVEKPMTSLNDTGIQRASWIKYQLLDEDQTPESKAFADYLEKRYVRLAYNGDSDFIRESIVTGTLLASVTIHEDFVAKLAAGEEAVSFMLDNQQIDSYRMQNTIDQYLQMAYAEIDDNGNLDQQALDELLDTRTDFIHVSRNDDNDKTDTMMIWHRNYYRSYGYIFFVVMMMLLGNLLMPFNTEGLKNRSLMSGFRQSKYQGQLIFGTILLALLVFAFFTAGSLVIGGWPTDRTLYMQYLLNGGVFSVVALTLSYMFVLIAPNRATVTAMANVIPLGMAFLSGVTIPQEYLGKGTLAIAKLFPMYYYVQAFDDSSTLYGNIGIQLLYAVVFILLTLVIGRVRKRDTVSFEVPVTSQQ